MEHIKKIFNLKTMFFIVLGTFFLAASYSIFFIPNEIAPGGVSGFATLLNALFGWRVGLLVLIMGTAPLFGRTVWWPDLATAIFGIVSAVVISGVTMHLARRKKGGDRGGNSV